MINDTISCSPFAEHMKNGNRKFRITVIYFPFLLKEIHLSGVHLNKVEQRRPWSTSMKKNSDLWIKSQEINILKVSFWFYYIDSCAAVY